VMIQCKEPRHDKVLYQVVLVLTRKFKIKLPESLRWGIAGWKGVGVLETKDVKGFKLVLDVSTPTDCQVDNTRPDLQVSQYLKRSKRLAILEVAGNGRREASTESSPAILRHSWGDGG
jgi:hypothetical protein